MGRRCDSFTDGVFWNGSIHWRGAWKRFNVDLGGIEEMPALPGPPRDSGTWKCVSFGESNGHLHLIEEPLPTKLRIFEMESDYSGWFVKYNIDLDGLVAEFPAIVHRSPKPFAPDWYAFSVLGVVREENEDESLLLLSLLDEVVSCSFKDGYFDGASGVGAGGN
ncbi:hypothetical protein Vadar_010884 [Vaccinium darrowii]|uniref:Uncharacterized protein n=1 Tax=Vaccinium darrowii TaxID=229202 RepID=A0ACB7YUG8_9ERIC|nr:hypothetical protein Vadar_010884 [Vaccinium darrowii]